MSARRLVTPLLVLGLAACSTAPAPPAPGSPQALLAGAAGAVRAVSSYHVTGTIEGGSVIDAVVIKGGWQGTITSHGVTFMGEGLGGKLWLKGHDMWKATSPSVLADQLGDNWVLVKFDDAGWGSAWTMKTLDHIIPDMLGVTKGATKTGDTTVDGQAATVIRTAKAEFTIEASGPGYPLRWAELKPVHGKVPAVLTLSAFGQPAPAITAPEGNILTLNAPEQG